jgi:hypothetical protein
MMIVVVGGRWVFVLLFCRLASSLFLQQQLLLLLFGSLSQW